MTGELPPELIEKKKPKSAKKSPKVAPKVSGHMAPVGATVEVTIDGKGNKRRGCRYEVVGVTKSHGKKFYRLADAKGKLFHLSPTSVTIAK